MFMATIKLYNGLRPAEPSVGNLKAFELNEFLLLCFLLLIISIRVFFDDLLLDLLKLQIAQLWSTMEVRVVVEHIIFNVVKLLGNVFLQDGAVVSLCSDDLLFYILSANASF